MLIWLLYTMTITKRVIYQSFNFVSIDGTINTKWRVTPDIGQTFFKYFYPIFVQNPFQIIPYCDHGHGKNFSKHTASDLQKGASNGFPHYNRSLKNGIQVHSKQVTNEIRAPFNQRLWDISSTNECFLATEMMNDTSWKMVHTIVIEKGMNRYQYQNEFLPKICTFFPSLSK